MTKSEPVHDAGAPQERAARQQAAYQDGQRWMRWRIIDVLRGEHPDLAQMVEKLPLHGLPSEEERIGRALDDAVRKTKPLTDVERAAARPTSEIMNMRLDSAAPAAHQERTEPQKENS